MTVVFLGKNEADRRGSIEYGFPGSVTLPAYPPPVYTTYNVACGATTTPSEVVSGAAGPSALGSYRAGTAERVWAEGLRRGCRHELWRDEGKQRSRFPGVCLRCLCFRSSKQTACIKTGRVPPFQRCPVSQADKTAYSQALQDPDIRRQISPRSHSSPPTYTNTSKMKSSILASALSFVAAAAAVSGKATRRIPSIAMPLTPLPQSPTTRATTRRAAP